MLVLDDTLLMLCGEFQTGAGPTICDYYDSFVFRRSLLQLLRLVLEGRPHVRAGVIPASRTDTAAHTVSGSCQNHAGAPRRRAHVPFARVHVPRDDGIMYSIHLLMQTRAAPMPYV